MITSVTGMQTLTISSNQPVSQFSHAGVSGGTQASAGMAEFAWSATGVGADCGLFPLRTPAAKQLTFYHETADKFSYSGSLLVGNLSITMDKEAKQNPITWSASGMFTGAVTDVATGVTDAGVYAAETGSYLDVKLADSNITQCLKTVTLNFTQNIGGYNCDYHYALGGNLAGSITIGLNDYQFDSITGETDVKVIVGALEESWDINYVLFNSSSVTGSRTDAGPVTNTVTGVFNLVNGGVRGPSGTTYYGSFP